MAESKKIGAALDVADSIQRRQIKEWRDWVGNLLNYINSLKENPTRQVQVDQAQHFSKIAQDLYAEIDESTRSWTKTREEIDARKSYMDLQAKIIEAWPRPATAERLFYVGTGFLGAGGVAYAYLGAVEVAAYVFLWRVGIACLIGSVIGLWRYDRDRTAYFGGIRTRLS